MATKFFINLAVLLCLSIPALAQEESGNTAQQQATLSQLGGNQFNVVQLFNDKNSKGVEGFPYLHEDWLQGTITWANGKKLGQVPLKLITYGKQGRQLMARRPQGDSVIIELPRIRQVVMYHANKDSTVIKRVIHQEQVNGDLLEVVYEGDRASLYIRHNAVLLPATKPGPYSNGRNTDVLEKQKHYLLKVNNDPALRPVRLRKKDFLEAFADKATALNSFCKSANIDFTNPMDIKKLLAHYHSI